MNKFILLISLSFILIANVSCKPKAPEVNPEYVGSWYGYDNSAAYTLTISENGVGSYQKFSGILTVTASGKTRVKGTKFKVGIKKFYMKQGPTLVNDNGYLYYEMILDDVVYERN